MQLNNPRSVIVNCEAQPQSVRFNHKPWKKITKHVTTQQMSHHNNDLFPCMEDEDHIELGEQTVLSLEDAALQASSCYGTGPVKKKSILEKLEKADNGIWLICTERNNSSSLSLFQFSFLNTFFS